MLQIQINEMCFTPGKINMKSSTRSFLLILLCSTQFMLFTLGADIQITTTGHLSPHAVSSIEQIMTCNRHVSCSRKKWALFSPCCGSCTCDNNCARHGICCIDAYESFTHGRESVTNTRYGCLLAQYLSPNETHFTTGMAFWMIKKCDPLYPNSSIIEQCQHPGLQVESAVPVTDPVTQNHFKNKYCAFCNWVGEDVPLIYWKLEILSQSPLSFPRSDLLQIIKKTRGNIFFREPEYVQVLTCKTIPEYSIETCNVTGLWTKYNGNVKKACESFVDPFNYTYKNYFCYLCNTETPKKPEDWICPIKKPVSDIVGKPQFFAVLDLHYILTGQGLEPLACSNEQFADEKAMVCRDVFCLEGRPENKQCITVRKNANESCLSVFMKLTVLQKERQHLITRMSREEFEEDVKAKWNYFYTSRDQSELERFERSIELEDRPTTLFIFFHKLDSLAHLDYAVVYVESKFRSRHHAEQLLDSLTSHPFMHLNYYWESFVNVSVELTEYSMKISDNETRLFIPNKDSTLVDELLANISSPYQRICHENDKIRLNKLYWCSYIKLDINELSMKLEGDLLYITGNTFNKFFKVLFKWEYELHHEKVYICLDDYLDIYYVMARQISNNLDVTNRASYQRQLHVLFHILSGLCSALIIRNQH